MVLRTLVWVAVPSLFIAISQYAFSASVSDSTRLLGLPYSDAYGYLIGATRLTSGLGLDEFAGRRPLYAGYLSSLLEVTGHSIPLACAIQALLVGLAICWFGEQAARRRGLLVAVVSAFISFTFYLRFTGKTLTENLGLLFGLIAWGAFQRWQESDRPSDLCLAYGSLSLGLVARAGPFFMLPAILLGLAMAPRQRISAVTFALLVLVAAAPFVLTRVYLWRVGPHSDEAFSNFSYTLYGVARGGKGWTYAASVLGAQVTSAEVYRAALDSIRHYPGLFVLGAARSVLDFLLPGVLSASGFVSMPAPGALRPLIWIPAQAAFLLGVCMLVRRRHEEPHRFDLWAMVGVVASLPFAPPFDADAMRAYAVAVPLIATTTAIGVQTMIRAVGGALDRGRGSFAFALAESGDVHLLGSPSRWTRYFPVATLILVSLLLLRPLTRSRSQQLGGTGGPLSALASSGVNCAPDRYFTLNTIYPSARISALSQLTSAQRRHPYPKVFEPLEQAFARSGMFDFAYAFAEETATMWPVALPLSVTHGANQGKNSLKICADRLESEPKIGRATFTLLLATEASL